MSRIKWLCWALAVFLTACLIPMEGWCVQIDPYIYRTFVGIITLEYEREDAVSGPKKTRSTFTQKYSLESKGNILSRRLIIYDVGVSFTRSDSSTETSSTSSESDSTQIGYFLRTTFLPRSRIPFSIFGRRSTRDSSTGVDTTTNDYGFEWYGHFIRLPETHVKVDRKTQTGTGQNQATTNYRLELEKDWGNTTNDFDSKHTTIDNNISDTSSTSSSANYRNITKLSSRTQLNLAAAVSQTKAADETETSAQGFSVSMSSRPSREFRQSHGYNFFRFVSEDSDGRTENIANTYSGSMGYRFTSRLTSSLGLSITNVDSESESTSKTTETIQGRASLSYRATDHLTITETVTYRLHKANSETDRKTLRVRTNARYSRQFDWVKFSGTYHVGYVHDEVPGTRAGTGVDQGVGLSLAQIDVTRFVGFNATASHERTKQLTGDIFERSTRYSLDGYNKVGNRYINLKGSYQRYQSDDWITGEQSGESAGIGASTGYFKNTGLGASYRWSRTFDDEVGTSRTASLDLSATHSRTIFKGRLRLSVKYRNTKSTYTDDEQTTQTITYLATYGKLLLKRVPWQIRAERRETEVDSATTSISTSVKNTFFYQLKAWSLSLEQEYQVTEYSTGKDADNRVFIRATRAFIRAF